MVENQDPDHLWWDDYVEKYKTARKTGEQSIWQRADIAAEVDTTYGGGELMRFSHSVEESFSTLIVYRWVANAWPEEDRNHNLSFRHHQLLAKLDDRKEWLQKCVDNKWSVAVLMEELKPPIRSLQESAIEELSRPKHPRQYTLEELMLLSVEERHRILKEAEFETFNPDEFWDNNPGEGFLQLNPIAAIEIMNDIIEEDQNDLKEMTPLDVLKIVFSTAGSVKFENGKFTFIPN